MKDLAEDEAIRIFQRLCVAPLPSPERFAESMNGSGLRWRKVRKSEAEVFGVGNSWRSALGEVTYQLVGGLRSGMGYAGAATLESLRTGARFMRVTTAGREESHPHDVTITNEAPNYQRG